MTIKRPTIGDFAQGLNIQQYDKTAQKKSDNRSKKCNDTLERVDLNIIQRQMYRRLMYGIYDYESEQIGAMSHATIVKIVLDHEKAKRLLHVMKAKKYYEAEDKLINAILPKAKQVSKKDHNWFLPLPKDATLRKLGISTKQIIDRFIEKNLLPKNFYEITPNNITL
ncbi:MAG: hypothetical protein EOL97_09030 [Spirochaetia bacterium]|nr:hypothetical protein [Spirochaetia bacterium]